MRVILFWRTSQVRATKEIKLSNPPFLSFRTIWIKSLAKISPHTVSYRLVSSVVVAAVVAVTPFKMGAIRETGAVMVRESMATGRK